MAFLSSQASFHIPDFIQQCIPFFKNNPPSLLGLSGHSVAMYLPTISTKKISLRASQSRSLKVVVVVLLVVVVVSVVVILCKNVS